MLYTVLGALLAVGGGIIAQRFKSYLDQAKEEQNILCQINDLLLDFSAVITSQGRVAADHQELQSANCVRENHTPLAVQGRHPPDIKADTNIGVQVSKFALDEPIRTKENLYLLTRRVQVLINKDLIQQYEAEIRARPDELT